MSEKYRNTPIEVNSASANKTHPFDFVSETDLAVGHCRGVDALEQAIGHQLKLLYAALDKAHLEREDGDYCPFQCDTCDRLRAV